MSILESIDIGAKMRLTDVENMRLIDEQLGEQGFPVIIPMEHAGRAVADVAVNMLGDNQRVVILAGKGNNGGDGFAAARWLTEYGKKVQCFGVGMSQREALTEYTMLINSGAEVLNMRTQSDLDYLAMSISRAGLVIDALLGTGFTEAGFGADLGAEKFLDIKCRFGGLKPSAVVMVATVRALKNHGGVAKADLNTENLEALEKGLPNLLQHVANIQNVYKLPCVVAINAFPTDTEAELELVRKKCSELGCNVALSKVWEKGGEGGIELANEVVRLCEAADENGEPLNKDFSYSYELDMSIEEKLNAIATKIYHADGVDFTSQAKKDIANLTKLGFDKVPICVAKTQYSFSDDQKLLGAPRNFRITVRSMKVSAGAGFIVALTGDIMTMPGLPKVPAAEKIDVDENGVISGLF